MNNNLKQSDDQYLAVTEAMDTIRMRMGKAVESRRERGMMRT